MVTVYEGNICKQPFEMVRTVPNDMLKRNLEQLAPKRGFDIEVAIDSFKLGSGFFSDGGSGVIIYHKKYKKKYHALVLEQKNAYGQAFLYIHYGGKSSNSMSIAMAKPSVSIMGGELHQHIPGFLTKAMAAGAQKGLQDEELYYDQLYTLIGEAIRLAYDMLANPRDYAPKAAPQPKPAPAPAPKTAPAPKATPIPKAAPTPPPAPAPEPVFEPQFDEDIEYIEPEKIAEMPFCFFDSTEKRALNFDALIDFHEEIYLALTSNPIFLKNPGITKTNLREISTAISNYMKELEAAKEDSFMSLWPGGNPKQLNDTLNALERNKKSYPIKKGTNALMLCIALTALGGNRGFFVTPDYFANQDLASDVEWTPLEEIQSITMADNRILVNGKEVCDKSWSKTQSKFDILVYAVGMALAMKYPVVEKAPEPPAPQPKAAPAPAPQPKAAPTAPAPKPAPAKPAPAAPKAPASKPAPAKPAFTAEKISDYPFAQPGYLMKRTLNFEALKAMHPQIHTALQANPIFKLHPTIQAANFRTVADIYDEYCNTDTTELSNFVPEVAYDSDLTDHFLAICRDITRQPLPFEDGLVPFMTYRRQDVPDVNDIICVTPDHLLIFTRAPHVTHCIALEEIEALAVQNDAIIVNGITYPLRRPFAPLQEKYNALIFFIGMILAMKYPTNKVAVETDPTLKTLPVVTPVAPVKSAEPVLPKVKPATKPEPKQIETGIYEAVPKEEPKSKLDEHLAPKKILCEPFTIPGKKDQRTLHFELFAKKQPQIWRALMENPIFKQHPDVKAANFDSIAAAYREYCGRPDVPQSANAPYVGINSSLTDQFATSHFVPGERSLPYHVIPFLEYMKADFENTDFFCVTSDALYICGANLSSTFWIALEDIQSLGVTENAIIVNGEAHKLGVAFTPLQEKFDALIYVIGMILAMKYPLNPAKPKAEPVKEEPTAEIKAEAKPEPAKEEPKADATDIAMDKIMKAKQMLDAGVINEEEFSAIKARILKEL